MTPTELRALIDTRVASDPAFAALVEARQAGDVTKDRAIAEALSAGRSRLRLRLTTSRGIYAALGLDDAALVMAVLRALAAGQVPGTGKPLPQDHPLAGYVPVFADLVPWLEPPCDGLDFGAADLQGVIVALAGAGLFTAAQRDKLLALGREPDPIGYAEVSAALSEGA